MKNTYSPEIRQRAVRLYQEQRSEYPTLNCLRNTRGGSCYDNAVVERFFGSLKYEGLGHTASMSESAVKQEITQFIRYYNFKRPHRVNNGMSPLEYENSQIKVSCAA